MNIYLALVRGGDALPGGEMFFFKTSSQVSCQSGSSIQVHLQRFLSKLVTPSLLLNGNVLRMSSRKTNYES